MYIQGQIESNAYHYIYLIISACELDDSLINISAQNFLFANFGVQIFTIWMILIVVFFSYLFSKFFMLLVGFILRIPFLDNPTGDLLFDDTDQWNVADEGFPNAGGLPLNVKHNDKKSPDDTQM